MVQTLCTNRMKKHTGSVHTAYHFTRLITAEKGSSTAIAVAWVGMLHHQPYGTTIN
jgi:hypothetical protein